MKFKIGDEVRCMNNLNVEDKLTTGLHYKVENIYNLNQEPCVGVSEDNGEYRVFYSGRFELATEQTPTLYNFTQADYDEMQDRIELLESLLVDANKRIVELETPVQVFNKSIEDYTLEDWQKAMNEKWVFQLNNGTEVYVNGIMDEFRDKTHPVELSNLADDEHVCTVTVQGYMFVGRPNHDSSVSCRIK